MMISRQRGDKFRGVTILSKSRTQLIRCDTQGGVIKDIFGSLISHVKMLVDQEYNISLSQWIGRNRESDKPASGYRIDGHVSDAISSYTSLEVKRDCEIAQDSCPVAKRGSKTKSELMVCIVDALPWAESKARPHTSGDLLNCLLLACLFRVLLLSKHEEIGDCRRARCPEKLS
ncbi:hypothetical protein EV127DRAFT_40274 [Xylaria flabelliformis]|nr:hypothetical protein EV127DRAFT_40274 [Xylaria flabelliformis]